MRDADPRRARAAAGVAAVRGAHATRLGIRRVRGAFRVAFSPGCSRIARSVGRVRQRARHAARHARARRADADRRRHDGGDGAGVLCEHARRGRGRDGARRFDVVLRRPRARPAAPQRARALLAVARHDAAHRAQGVRKARRAAARVREVPAGPGARVRAAARHDGRRRVGVPVLGRGGRVALGERVAFRRRGAA